MKTTSTVTQVFRARGKVASSWVWTFTNHYVSSFEMYSIDHMPIHYDGDDGGPWHLVRQVDLPTLGYINGNDPNKLLVDGEFVVDFPSGYTRYSTPSEFSTADLDSFGTTAIARSAPTNPAFSLSTSLGELVGEGIPAIVGSSLLKERVKAARSAGSEYLGVEFGWRPLLRDLQSFAKTVKESERILHQYRKDSGMKIRRGYDGKADTGTKLYQGNNIKVISNATLSATGTVTENWYEKQWFRGAFKYHIPVSDTVLGKFREWSSMSNHLLGWKVTPETVWNLAPWSWAADWFANTGDVMANISNLGTDGLVLQYGYSMATRRREALIAGTTYARYGQSAYMTRKIMEEWKQRRPATPYGFGVNLQTLSPKQIAIMAALGLSKT
jgi:hypothetical protein